MNNFAFYIAGIATLDLLAIISAKFWIINKNSIFLVATCLLFAGSGYMFAKALKFEGMGITNAVWTSISAILAVVGGYLIFKENITLIQAIGIAVIIVGLVLINLK